MQEMTAHIPAVELDLFAVNTLQRDEWVTMEEVFNIIAVLVVVHMTCTATCLQFHDCVLITIQVIFQVVLILVIGNEKPANVAHLLHVVADLIMQEEMEALVEITTIIHVVNIETVVSEENPGTLGNETGVRRSVRNAREPDRWKY